MCMYIYIYLYVGICLFLYGNIYTYICMYECIHTYIYIGIYVYVYIYSDVRMAVTEAEGATWELFFSLQGLLRFQGQYRSQLPLLVLDPILHSPWCTSGCTRRARTRPDGPVSSFKRQESSRWIRVIVDKLLKEP